MIQGEGLGRWCSKDKGWGCGFPLSNVTVGYSVVNLYPGKRVKVDRLIECNSNQYPGAVGES